MSSDPFAQGLSARPPMVRLNLTVAALLIVMAASVFLVNWKIDQGYPRRRVEKLLYLPSGKYLKPAVLGYDNLAADYLWLKAIGYFGGHYLSDQNYPWLAHILNLVTDLDPKFAIVYYFGGIVLALEADNVDASIAILEKGMRNVPDNWKYPFFLGFDYFYFKGDLLKAAGYLRQAADIPDHPQYLPKLAASLYARAGQLDEAIRFLESVERTLEDQRWKANLRKKIEDLKAGRIPRGLDGIYPKRGS